VIVDFGPFLDPSAVFYLTRSTIRYDTVSPAQPYPDHFMPVLTALGAAGPGTKGTILHQRWYGGNRGMGAYKFGQNSRNGG